jgi:hypothetical protein
MRALGAGVGGRRESSAAEQSSEHPHHGHSECPDPSSFAPTRFTLTRITALFSVSAWSLVPADSAGRPGAHAPLGGERSGGCPLLGLIAYNLGNLLRRLALPFAIQSWSLTSLQQRLFKTRAHLLRHARSYRLQLAESHGVPGRRPRPT